MTLPYTDKPDVNDTVQTIIDTTKSNLDYLDTNPSAYCFKIVTRAMSAGAGNESITIGFQPRNIIIFGTNNFSASSYGFYGTTSGWSDLYYGKRSTILLGSYSSHRWGFGGGWSTYIVTSYDGVVDAVLGKVKSVNSTGFVYQFTVQWDLSPTDYNYSVCFLCIK